MSSPEHAPHHDYFWRFNPLDSARVPHVLDIGCGDGAIAGGLAANGHKVTGIDADSERIATARSAFPSVAFHVKSTYDDLADIAPADGWDAIVSLEVIEHLYDPGAHLAKIHALLRPDGVLVLSTPFHGYLKNLAISVMDGWDKHFHVETVGGHIKFFSVDALATLMLNHGLAIERWRGMGRAPWLWRSMFVLARRRTANR